MESSYRQILRTAKDLGYFREDRTGIGSKSIFSSSISFDLTSGLFPLITGKKMFFKNIISEFLWFINGETNIDRFKKYGVSIWDAWADEDGNLGPVYGYQMVNYNGQKINQLEQVIDSLINNPDSRRHIITLWNPIQLKEMRLPPCYLYFQFFVENGRLNLQVVQRSADLFIGVPYDIAMLSLFLIYIANKVELTPAILKITMVDAHV